MKLYLGAGKDRREGYKHADIYPFEGIDDVFDATAEGLWPYGDNTFDEVFTQDFLEHINPTRKVHVINEIWRILKPGGVMEHWFPNAGSRNDFGSPSHIAHWNLQQFEHFDVDSYRYNVDHEYEGFIGSFRKVLAEEVNPLTEKTFEITNGEEKIVVPFIVMQGVHVIYEAVK